MDSDHNQTTALNPGDDDDSAFFDEMNEEQLAAAKAELAAEINDIQRQLDIDLAQGFQRSEAWRIRACDAIRHKKTEINVILAIGKARRGQARYLKGMLKDREISLEKEKLKTERHRITAEMNRDFYYMLVKAWMKTHGIAGLEALIQNAEQVFPENEIILARRAERKDKPNG